MAANTGYCSTNESCKVRIPLFPLRYSAHPRPKGGADYAYDAASLDTGFQKLDHAQYGLRCVGAGFVYLFDETEGTVFVWRVNEENGQFVELLSRYRSLEAALGGYKPGRSLSHIWANERSVVHILLTDTLLTERKIREIESNQDGIRAKLATTIDVKAWADSAPARNTFAAGRLGELVEEFKGTDLSFSPSRIRHSTPSAQSLVPGMKAVAPTKQIAVVMHDNIALVQDLRGMFHVSRSEMEAYNSAPDAASKGDDIQRYRKTIIARLIGRIYEAAYANSKGINLQDEAGQEKLDKALKRDVYEYEYKRKWFEDNLAVQEREPARYRPSSYPSAKAQLDAMPKDPVGQRAAVLALNAERYSRHVKEDERVAYLKNFERELEQRHIAVLDHKNDRCAWLKSYRQSAKPADFGATFLRYDLTDPVASTSHATAFSHCIEGMIWGTATTPAGKKDHERALFGEWWALPWKQNPILENLGHDKGFGDTLVENKADVLVDTAAGKVFAGLVRFVAVQYLMEQVGVYTLTRAPNWRGAVRNSVDALIHRLAGTGSEADAAHLRGLLEERYGDRIVGRRLTLAEGYARLGQVPGVRGLTAEGSIAQHAGNEIVLLEWERLTPLTRYANPFLQVFEGGAASGVAVLSIWNLMKAIEDFRDGSDILDVATQSNLVAAVLGTASALNGALISTRALAPVMFENASVLGGALRAMASTGALRYFGYGGALADAATNWLKAYKQYQIGNTSAGTYYAMAGAGMLSGGIALTNAGAGAMTTGIGLAGSFLGIPVWGWIVAGVILLGLGLWWLFKGEDARYSDLEFWLNDGTFGRRSLLGRESGVVYPSLDAENKAYVEIHYAPKKSDSEWKIFALDTLVSPVGTVGVTTTYSPRLVVEIAYPLEGEILPLHPVSARGAMSPRVSGGSEMNLKIRQDRRKPLASGGTLLTYAISGLRSDVDFDLALIAEYVPKLLGEPLTSTYSFANEDVPWYYRSE
ncbi:toxin VasX [Achromobacter sp.]|uniref:toxin VasX n=1 Tax=Achromobacter sp. TaxID=134375 RepID=UPI0031CFCA98